MHIHIYTYKGFDASVNRSARVAPKSTNAFSSFAPEVMFYDAADGRAF